MELAVQVTRSPTRGESILGVSVAVPDKRLRSSRGSIRGQTLCCRRDRGTDDTGRPVFLGRMGERSHIVVSFADVVCIRMTTAHSARRPGAEAVPGRWGLAWR